MRLAIGKRYRNQLEDALREQEIQVLWIPDNPDLDERLAGHADLSIFSGEDIIIASRKIYTHVVKLLTFKSAILESSAKQGPVYPTDAALCACSTGKYLIYNPKTTDPLIPEKIKLIPIPVNQGYTNCSVCVVSNDAIITADDVIASKAIQAGMEVLKITPGYIRLDGFDYGFIGGASFLLDTGRMAFTGILSDHPDCAGILAFLERHGLEPVYLTKAPIFDIGGAVWLP